MAQRDTKQKAGNSSLRGYGVYLTAGFMSFFLSCALCLLASSPPATAALTTPIINHIEVEDVHATLARVGVDGEAPGSLDWRLEYSTASANGPWTLGKSGTSAANGVGGGQYAVDSEIEDLIPSTNYFVRYIVENEFGSSEKTASLSTSSAGPPEIEQHECPLGELRPLGETHYYEPHHMCYQSTTTSAEVEARIETNGSDTKYSYEYSSSKQGPFVPVPGGSGSVTASEDHATSTVHLEGLMPESTYYIMLSASNGKGKISETQSFSTTTVKPSSNIESATDITSNSAHIQGFVRPQTYETSWRFEYATSEAGPWSAVPGASGVIAKAEADEQGHPVQGDLSGLSPLHLYYVRLFSENANGSSTSAAVGFETGGKPHVESFAVHALDGSSLRVLGSVLPDGYDTHFYVQYVGEEQFEKSGWAEAASSTIVDAGVGTSKEEVRSAEGKDSLTVFEGEPVGADLPGLQPGGKYRFRFLASNTEGEAQGNEQILSVPVVVQQGGETCANEGLRTGLSAHLPDCRAYEQITPADKEGAAEAFTYLNPFGGGVLIGEDGEHLMLDKHFTVWGSGDSPYFFSRSSTGWNMTAGTPQPEAGIDVYHPELYSPDLTQFAFSSGWQTSSASGVKESSAISLRSGVPGGPYSTAVASVPRSNGASWVAASADFGKLILASEDRTLLGRATGTTSGQDLYEDVEGQLHQVNVLSDGAPISSCGALPAHGEAETYTTRGTHPSTPDTVSANGSVVFFTDNCTHDLYARIDGDETEDIGEYIFLAANPEGSTLLLEKQNGGAHEIVLYDRQNASAKTLFVTQEAVVGSIRISENFAYIYFQSKERLTKEAPPTGTVESLRGDSMDLYVYDVGGASLDFALQEIIGGGEGAIESLTPDGNYYYFSAIQAGGVPAKPAGTDYNDAFYRYDRAEKTVDCVSCASPFDPEPKLGLSPELEAINAESGDGVAKKTYVSANGDYAFFATPAALVPQDQDGEDVIDEGCNQGGCGEDVGGSPSTDVYEWRKPGLDGCEEVQGCLSLITSGSDGYFVALFGTTESGRDVFFATRSQLVPQDQDNSVDIYDARIGGGFPVPARPVECEGDTCSTPLGLPNDSTPASFTFSGSGNILQSPLAGETKAKKAKAKKTKKPKKKSKKKKKAGKRTAAKAHRKAGKSSRRSK